MQKVTNYLDDNRLLLNRRIFELKRIYGKYYSFLRLLPISPDDVARYLYIKDELGENENQIYLLMNLDICYWNREMLSEILDVTLEVIDNIIKSLYQKIAYKFKDENNYKHFYNSVLGIYQSRIYRENKEYFDISHLLLSKKAKSKK